MKLCLALVAILVTIWLPATASAEPTGTISGPEAVTNYDTGVTTISVSNLVVNTDCQPGFRALLPGWPTPYPLSYTVTGCGAAAYVVDERYRRGTCPQLDETDSFSLISSAWFVPPEPPARTLSSGAGTAVAPPIPANESPSQAYIVCLYQTEMRSDSGTENETGFEEIFHNLVAEATVIAPPSLRCVDLRAEYQKGKARVMAAKAAKDKAVASLKKAKKELLIARKEAKKAKGIRKLKMKRKVEAKERAVTKAQQVLRLAPFVVSDAYEDLRKIRQEGSYECGFYHPIEG